MTAPRYPSLYQINTRVWLTELSRRIGRSATLDDISETELDRLAEMGFDWIWFLGVWQTGPAAQQVSRTNPAWRRDFEETLTDLSDNDIRGSGFAITGYTVHQDLGGDAALARLRKRLQQRGLKLMLDFVPNHMGLGHPWVENHPDYFVPGSELDLARAPQNYTWVKRKRGDVLLAYGRDPYFDGWSDTLQLNYANPDLQDAMIGELTRIANQCDGVCCDMAMLVLPEFLNEPGANEPLFSGRGPRKKFAGRTPTLPSWPKSIGTWNGHSNSEASTIPTTSGSTIACGSSTPDPFASIFWRGSIIRIG
jgi:glycosidase